MIQVQKLQPPYAPAPFAAWIAAWTLGMLVPVLLNAALFAPHLTWTDSLDLGSSTTALGTMLIIAVPASLAAAAMFWRSELEAPQPLKHWLWLSALTITPFALIAFALNLVSLPGGPETQLIDYLSPMILLYAYSQLGALLVRSVIRICLFLWPPAYY